VIPVSLNLNNGILVLSILIASGILNVMHNSSAFANPKEPTPEEKSIKEKTAKESKAAHERMLSRYGSKEMTFPRGQRHVLEDGTVIEPDGTFKFTNGTILSPDGRATLPNGKVLKKGETDKLPDGTSVSHS
jgi:hypothetical protein